MGERRAAAQSSCPALSSGRCEVHKPQEILPGPPLVLGTPWTPQCCHRSSSSAWGRSSLQAMVEQSPQHCQGTDLSWALPPEHLAWVKVRRAQNSTWLMKQRLFSASPFAGTGCCQQRQGVQALLGAERGGEAGTRSCPKGREKRGTQACIRRTQLPRRFDSNCAPLS